MLTCTYITSVFDVLVAFVLVVSTCSNVHTLLCLCKSNFRCILVYLYVFKTGPKYSSIACGWELLSIASSHSFDLKIM